MYKYCVRSIVVAVVSSSRSIMISFMSLDGQWKSDRTNVTANVFLPWDKDYPKTKEDYDCVSMIPEGVKKYECNKFSHYDYSVSGKWRNHLCIIPGYYFCMKPRTGKIPTIGFWFKLCLRIIV